MKEDNTSENPWLFYPASGEAAPETAVLAGPTPEPTGAADPSPEASSAPGSSSSPASWLTLESLENPFRRTQPTPIHWAVGWADLMMTMFILFLVMYLYPSAKVAQALRFEQGSPASEMQQSAAVEANRAGLGTSDGLTEANPPPTDTLFDLARLSREDEEFARFVEIAPGADRTVRLILAADLLFPSGEADLRLIAKENINKISELLKETPYTINVVGHSDDQPIRGGAYATNWELSVMRATAVARFLIEEMGVAASRITISGQSFYQPQAANDTPANRAKNRRVEIIVSLEPSPPLPLAKPTVLVKSGEI